MAARYSKSRGNEFMQAFLTKFVFIAHVKPIANLTVIPELVNRVMTLLTLPFTNRNLFGADRPIHLKRALSRKEIAAKYYEGFLH